MPKGTGNVVDGIIQLVIGLGLLPTAGAFYYIVTTDTNLSGIAGFVAIIGIAMVLVGIGIAYNAYKRIIGAR